MSTSLIDDRVAFARGERRPAVEAHAVSKTYASRVGDVRALAPVSLSIAQGSFVAVVGRSGCGKSTLLRLLAGLIKPTEGTVDVYGVPIDGPPSGARYVFQDYGQSLLPWKTVEQNVAFGLRHSYHQSGEAQATTSAADCLALVGLELARHRYPWELSGGMQQRVAIARAIAAQPTLLLFDEPFSSVDALSRAQLQDMILQVWSKLRPTVVLVTHDIDEAVYLADRVVVLGPNGAGIAADVTIDLPRPRRQIETRELEAYLAYRRQLLRLVLD